MATWIWIFVFTAGSLFAFKIIYVLCTALVVTVTQGALYVSTSRVRISAVLDAVPMRREHLLIDLGCGDGRVLRKARERYGVRTLGYEINLLAYLKARLLCAGSRGINIKWQNFWTAYLSEADVIFCYLYPDVMQRLSKKLGEELKTGAVIVSANFSIPGFKPIKLLQPGNSLHNSPLYIYRI